MARTPPRQQGWAHSRGFTIFFVLAILTTLWPWIRLILWILTAPFRLFS